MSRRSVVFARILISMFIAVSLDALIATGAATTEPTTRPSPSASAAKIKQAFSDLANRDGSVRETARMQLMGMRREDLPALRAAVQESRPLAPSQTTALYDIVTHVFLAGESYTPDGARGFLGVSFPNEPTEGEEAPVVIAERIPGFCAFRYLQEGDVILAMVGPPEVRFENPSHFRRTIGEVPPGKEIELEILRQGQVIHVPLKLDVRPQADEPTMRQLRRERDQKAYTYWQENFATLVGDEVS